ncbi:hydrogenase expression/formation protein HypE [candidate division KSB1 bacterium]
MYGNKSRIMMGHGAGGSMSQSLVKDFFLKHIGSPELSVLDDAASIMVNGTGLAFSTDTFVVKPLFFPGGNIGSLAVSGTVNDLLMQGSRPMYLSLGFIIEEGFPFESLEKILISIGETAEKAGVRIVTGDTKVVNRNEADGIFINTSGIGELLQDVNTSCANAQVGDAVILSGTVGEHGIAVMAERHGLKLQGAISSDESPQNHIIIPLLEKFSSSIHILRDPTRGGVAAALNEIAESSNVEIEIEEESVSISSHVRSVCDILGFDPFYLPCEGRFIAFVEGIYVDKVVTCLHESLGCTDAAVIGRVTGQRAGRVKLTTFLGGKRILDMPSGEILPRIC